MWCSGIYQELKAVRWNKSIEKSGRNAGLQKEGVKGISALIFWNSALKIKLKGEITLCILRFQC